VSRSLDLTPYLDIDTQKMLRQVCELAPALTPCHLVASVANALETLFGSALAGSQMRVPTNATEPAAAASCCECGIVWPDDQVIPIPWDGRYLCRPCYGS
jgi:hypothetical protein